jgi:flagellar export protein FliJ
MFRYRLETLLRYRKSMEEDAQRTLAGANRRYLDAVASVDAVEAARQTGFDEKRSKLAAIEHPGVYALYDNYFRGAMADAWDGRRRVEAARELVTMERGKLAEAMKERRILDAHRDRLKERYDGEEGRKERIAADEMALVRYKKKGLPQ